MPNYQNGKIYAIRSINTPSIYIGSTTRLLCQRFGMHKFLFKNNKLRCSSREILQYEDAYIELIQNYPCNSYKELTLKESEIIKITPNCINIQLPQRTKKQYRKDTKQHIKERDKLYYENNKDELLKKQAQYRLLNKEVILEKQRKHWNENKDKLNEARRLKRAIKKHGLIST